MWELCILITFFLSDSKIPLLTKSEKVLSFAPEAPYSCHLYLPLPCSLPRGADFFLLQMRNFMFPGFWLGLRAGKVGEE
jgi:hypothetical protein